MHLHNSALAHNTVSIKKMRRIALCTWTLLDAAAAIWECSDNIALKAIAISSPRLEQAIEQSNITHVGIIAVIWLMGLGLIWLSFHRIVASTEALEAERDNLSSVFDATPMPMLLFDDRLEVERVNAAFRSYCVDYISFSDRRCGTILRCANALSEPEGCGNAPACDSCRIMRALREVSRSGMPCHGETTFSRTGRNGSTTEILLLYGLEAVVLDGQSHVLMSFLDISERKVMERKLAAREQEFRSLAANLPDNIARYDRECRILYINPALEKTLGTPLEQVVGKVPTEIPFGGYLAEYQAKLEGVLATGINSWMELLEPDGDGGIQYYHIQMVAERDNEGSIIGALIIGRDITESKRQEKLQAAREEEFRALVENSPDIIARYDQFCRRVYVNPALEQLAGKPADYFIGKTPSEASVAVPEVGWQVHEAVERVFEQGEQLEIEVVWKDSRGASCHFLSRYVPELDAEGNVATVLSISRDITSLRSAESLLLHVQKMESVGLLAGGVAHDFNNILSVIAGYAELLKLTIKDAPDKLAYVEEIAGSVARGAELTRSLLAFSGKHEPHKQYDSLNQIVANLQKSMSRLLRSDIELAFQLCDDQLPVFVDRGQIEQIMINLMVNARDALASGGRICVDTAVVEAPDEAGLAPGNYALVTVADNGTGMDSETVARIFDPFFTTKEPGKGTGLGLAIVSGIIGNHGGYINVESTPGSGSVFKVYLPLYTGEMQTKQASDLEKAALRGNETVLLADDEPNLLKMNAEMLSRYGYTVLTAADGEEALHVFEAHQEEIQAVIIDMIMPRMNGRETIARLRLQKPDLPIILTSGYTDAVLDVSDIHFLPKPVHIKKLTETLRAALGKAVSVDCFAGNELMQPELFPILPAVLAESEDRETDDWL